MIDYDEDAETFNEEIQKDDKVYLFPKGSFVKLSPAEPHFRGPVNETVSIAIDIIDVPKYDVKTRRWNYPSNRSSNSLD